MALILDMPDDVAQRITEAFCASFNSKNKTDYGVRIIDTHQHNACNHTVTGVVVVDGADFGFVVQIGDWNGFDVKEYGPAEDCTQVYSYEPPEPTRFILRPTNYAELKAYAPEKLAIAMKWIQQPHIQQKLNDYHYDRHFQPGCAIEKHYKDWAKSQKLEFVVDNEDGE